METRILIIDRDKMFVKGLKYSLEQEGFIVDTIFNDKEILERVSTNKYSIILLGVELQNSKGFNICKSIRDISKVPIIVMMEKGEDIDKILALEQGADDYAIKPFNILVFKSKIKAILRRENYKSVDTNSQMSKFHNLKTLILLISTIIKKEFTPLISNMLSDTKTKNDGGEIT